MNCSSYSLLTPCEPHKLVDSELLGQAWAKGNIPRLWWPGSCVYLNPWLIKTLKHSCPLPPPHTCFRDPRYLTSSPGPPKAAYGIEHASVPMIPWRCWGLTSWGTPPHWNWKPQTKNKMTTFFNLLPGSWAPLVTTITGRPWSLISKPPSPSQDSLNKVSTALKL